MSNEIIREQKPEEKMSENMDEIIKNVVKDIKKKKDIPSEQLEVAMKTANENLEFLTVLDEINLACPNDRVIYVDGNEELVYDNGEFFLCDTINSKKARKKLKRKEATEKYIEYFIRYQLNPIIEQKKINNLTKTITSIDKTNDIKPEGKEIVNKVPEKIKSEKQKEVKDKPKVQKSEIKKTQKVKESKKEDLER